jgi:hypothetical protein
LDLGGLIRARLIKGRYCNYCNLGYWYTAILKQNCNKERIISFLYWIYKTYLVMKRKKGKRKSANQYWRDFKILYRRVNSSFIDTNDSNEVVKAYNPSITALI